MHPPHRWFCIPLLLLTGSSLHAGLHYSGEEYNPLPSQWRGFLLDQRHLRQIAIAPAPKAPVSANRLRYDKAAAELEKTARARVLTADESADLGALHVRLGNQIGRASCRERV